MREHDRDPGEETGEVGEQGQGGRPRHDGWADRDSTPLPNRHKADIGLPPQKRLPRRIDGFIPGPAVDPVMEITISELGQEEFPHVDRLWEQYRGQQTDRAIDRVFGAFSDGTLVGTARVRCHPDGFEVDGVFVSETHRGEGLARRLVQAVLGEFGGHLQTGRAGTHDDDGRVGRRAVQCVEKRLGVLEFGYGVGEFGHSRHIQGGAGAAYGVDQVVVAERLAGAEPGARGLG